MNVAGEVVGAWQRRIQTPLQLYLPRMATLSITWFGHSTFIITTPGGKRIVTDPWLEGNPTCPAGARGSTRPT